MEYEFEKAEREEKKAKIKAGATLATVLVVAVKAIIDVKKKITK